MTSHVLHTVWCRISGEAAGEVWKWSLLGVKGLTSLTRIRKVMGWLFDRDYYHHFACLSSTMGKRYSIQRRPDNFLSFTTETLSLFSRDDWGGHRFQNYLLNHHTDERDRQLSGYPRHNQEPLHEDANELLGTQLGRSWSDGRSFPRSFFDPARNFHLSTGSRRGCAVPTIRRKFGLVGFIFISVFAGFHCFRTLLRHHETFQCPPQNHYQEVKDLHSRLLGCEWHNYLPYFVFSKVWQQRSCLSSSYYETRLPYYFLFPFSGNIPSRDNVSVIQQSNPSPVV